MPAKFQGGFFNLGYCPKLSHHVLHIHPKFPYYMTILGIPLPQILCKQEKVLICESLCVFVGWIKREELCLLIYLRSPWNIKITIWWNSRSQVRVLVYKINNVFVYIKVICEFSCMFLEDHNFSFLEFTSSIHELLKKDMQRVQTVLQTYSRLWWYNQVICT